MADLSIIKEIADQVLSIPTLKGTPDRYLIDRAYRVLRHCGSIAQLNEVRCFQVDNECLTVGALFRDAGFARYANQEDKAIRMVLADLTDEDMRDFSAQVIHEKLIEVWDLVRPILEDIGAWFTEEGPGVLETLQELWGKSWSLIKEAAAIVVEWFQENLPLIQEAGQTLIAFWEEHIVPALDNIWEIIKTIVTTAIQAVLGIIRTVMQIITAFK